MQRRSTSRGTSNPKSALLMLLRTKILEKLPATMSGNYLARMAVAACSLDEPIPKLEPEARISLGLAIEPKSGP